VERLQKEVTALRAEAEERRINIDKAGSIAEASLSLTKIFEDAEEASKLYLENVERLSQDQNRVNAAREEESKKKAEQLIMMTAKKCREMEAATAQKCRQMLNAAAKKAAEEQA
jgi:transposase-like protein